MLWWASWLSPFLGRSQRPAPRTEYQPSQSQPCRQGVLNQKAKWMLTWEIKETQEWAASNFEKVSQNLSSTIILVPSTSLLPSSWARMEFYFSLSVQSHFWQLWTKADEDTAPLEASLLIRSGKSLHSYQGIFLINTVQWMLVLPAAVLIPSCDLKYLMAANHYSSFYPRIFCHFQHLSFSGINFIFLPCKKWTDELQTSWQAPHKHILVLTHWGVSKMWSQVTHFLSPRAKPQGSTYFKRQKHVENLDRPMFLQWKYRFYDFLLNTFRLVGRGG